MLWLCREQVHMQNEEYAGFERNKGSVEGYFNYLFSF